MTVQTQRSAQQRAALLRKRAEESVTLADGFKDSLAKQMMLEIAEKYRKLADKVERDE